MCTWTNIINPLYMLCELIVNKYSMLASRELWQQTWLNIIDIQIIRETVLTECVLRRYVACIHPLYYSAFARKTEKSPQNLRFFSSNYDFWQKTQKGKKAKTGRFELSVRRRSDILCGKRDRNLDTAVRLRKLAA